MSKNAAIALGVIFLLGAGAQLFHVARLYQHPLEPSVLGRQRWYKLLIAGVSVNAVISGACFSYAGRVSRSGHSENRHASTSWESRRELRAALLYWAAVQMLMLPINAVETYHAYDSLTFPGVAPRFKLDHVGEGVIHALIGLMVIYYDRRRLARGRRDAGLMCHVCRYDLRATPERCPECGTPRTLRQLPPVRPV